MAGSWNIPTLPGRLADIVPDGWYVLTGPGVYYFVVVIEYLPLYFANTRLAGGSNPQNALRWTDFLHLPYIRSSGPKMGGLRSEGTTRGSTLRVAVTDVEVWLYDDRLERSCF
jgi:hypothetical protein